MDGRRLVVVEANEVPRRVIADLARSGRLPFLAGLLGSGRLLETVAKEPGERELYPSQTWASMNTGVRSDRHGIYWYGDPKPSDYPLYWQAAAEGGRSVGVVNTLHSSPLRQQCRGDQFRFVVPDSFSTDSETIPVSLRSFQEINLGLTRTNARRTQLRAGLGPMIRLLPTLPRLGVRPATLSTIAQLFCGVAAGQIPRERLRSAQFLVLADLFRHLLDDHRPDVAVMFTNHVAANMHRYWYALYPDDFDAEHYDTAWVDRYRGEIPAALVLLDRFLDRLHRWCVVNDRTLVVVSSMGQGPSRILTATTSHEAVVADPRRFLDALGVDRDVEVRGSMVPQLTLACRSPDRAAATERILVDAGGAGGWLVDRRDAVVTVTYRLEVVDQHTVVLHGAPVPATSIGAEVYPVDDHSSGRHDPVGILGVANSPSFDGRPDGVVDALEVAPAILTHLGLAPLDHHVSPSFHL